MTTEQIIDLAKFAMVVAGGYGGLVKFFDYLKDREQKKLEREIALARESSAGQAAIAELREDDKKVRKDLDELESRVDDHDGEVKELKQHYEQLINRVWDFFKK